MKKFSYIKSLLIVFLITLGFLLPQKFVDAQSVPRCCCGYEGTPAPASKESCEASLKCYTITSDSLCSNNSTDPNVQNFDKILGTANNKGDDKCATTTKEMKQNFCSTETQGLLAGTSPGCTAQGTCTVCDFIKVFTNVARLILGVSGAFALLLFIYGGFTMITSQGNQDSVKKGKDILTSTVMGIVIVLASWQITRIVLMTIVVNDSAKAEEQELRELIFKAFTKPPTAP